MATRVELAPTVAHDFECILKHLAEHEVEDAASRIADIVAAISVLERNPFIGRPLNEHQRELIIGRGSHGYVALYRYEPVVDVAFVLALRSQREAGYTRG